MNGKIERQSRRRLHCCRPTPGMHMLVCPHAAPCKTQSPLPAHLSAGDDLEEHFLRRLKSHAEIQKPFFILRGFPSTNKFCVLGNPARGRQGEVWRCRACPQPHTARVCIVACGILLRPFVPAVRPRSAALSRQARPSGSQRGCALRAGFSNLVNKHYSDTPQVSMRTN
jgi:hypothetical protein